ncbi:MAG: anhydro-N-acetylmuramic acid kinase, partial [Parvularculaceae bacterium]|nr:anhydro-N-acetylmuramic acid kinase [Parvularculaceae bacterium]
MSLSSVRRLAALAEAPQRRIIGLMSGTSLDGLDIALGTFQEAGLDTKFELEQFTTIPYTQDFRETINTIFAAAGAVSLKDVTLLNAVIARTHAQMINDALADWTIQPSSVDLIASHGQTVYHAPAWMHGRADMPNATLQLGDGDHIAHLTGIATLSDFRQKHIAAGAEGAPLAAYGDVLLLSDDHEDRLLVNIGGIANFTFLPAAPRQLAAFSADIGPGNTLMDGYVQHHFPELSYDQDGKLARSGQVNEDLLKALLGDPYLAAPFPKTTGPEHFSAGWLQRQLTAYGDALSHQDVLATLNQFTAQAIANAARSLPHQPKVYLSGGGAMNNLLRENLSTELGQDTLPTTDALGMNPDAKEAIL